MARYRVNSDIGLRVRDEPNGTRIGAFDDGAIVETVDEGTQSAGGYTWLKVRAEQGGLEGWVATEYLVEIDGGQDQQEQGESHLGGSGVRERILTTAAKRKGIPYRMPPDRVNETCLDCSSFVSLTFRDAGVPFPAGVYTAEQIRQASVQIDSSEVLPGDLVFFQNTYNAGEGVASHVGISLGAGTHQMWDCHAFPGDSGPPGVGITNISVWWPDYWLCAGRPRQLG